MIEMNLAASAPSAALLACIFVMCLPSRVRARQRSHNSKPSVLEVGNEALHLKNLPRAGRCLDVPCVPETFHNEDEVNGVVIREAGGGHLRCGDGSDGPL